ncbi:MAG TPA: pyridoxal-phosphate dependent enzyme [Gemmatimonadaceae bacterium]|nr:pyridoxal-phosphate dependent enzyme [Gemmatimonadaceae bacterium]
MDEFHAANPLLRATPLRSLSSLSASLGIGPLDVKDETERYGLDAFKITGVSYALHRLSAAGAQHIVCATAGNHGRAVARGARDRRLPCTVFVPALRTEDPIEARTRTARVRAMHEDGARVVDVDGTYEDAVERAADFARTSGATVVSDTSWDGYETIPRWIMAGYTRLFEEASGQWDDRPDVVIVQGGVGGLVCAAVSWFAHRFGPRRPFLIACEPENAACLLASAAAGHPVTIDSTLETIMAGLRCAAPSPLAWPPIASLVDAFVTIRDADVVQMLNTLCELPAGERIAAGPSGACGLATLAAIMRTDEYAPVRQAARMDRSTRVLAVVTEGA